MKATVNKISATKAARNFSDLLSRVQYRREEFQITRGNEVVAVISPFSSKPRTIGELQESMKSWPKLDADDSASWLKEIEELRKQSPLPPSPWE
jgi:antitoxin (DNA-binding transcriptional repressor) of toxin-antitoxin stability system